MPKNRTLAIALALATAGLLDTALHAQDVILSEVCTGGTDRWIELHNRSAAAVDVSAWSIYLATTTANRPQTYWWPLPSGTVLAPDSYLRVHWYQNAPAVVAPGEAWTGTSIYQFLFGLGGEALPTTAGALALLRSQLNAAMNTPSIVADFVEYGAGGLPREALAVQAGAWTAGHSVAAPSALQSLARNPSLVGVTAPELQWLLDDSPTPGGPNVGSAAVIAVGTPCAVLGHHLLGAPELRSVSTPVLGNGAFGLQLTNTTGTLLEHCILAFTADLAPAGLPNLLPPVAGGGCALFVDYRTPLAATWTRTGTSRTNLPLPLPAGPAGLAGMTFAAQAIVFDLTASAWPPYQGASNALAITLGN